MSDSNYARRAGELGYQRYKIMVIPWKLRRSKQNMMVNQIPE